LNKGIRHVYAIISLILALGVFTPRKASALFGADAAAMIPYLIQIISQAVKQYNELRSIYGQATDHKRLVESINQGLNEAIGLLESLPVKDEEILGQLRTFRHAMSEVEQIYGKIPKGAEFNLLQLHDQTVAESIKIANALKQYASKQEQNSIRIASRAGSTSPKGAARVNLETNAAILHTLNQLLRVNGQMLKLQSEQLAFSNKKGKEAMYQYQKLNSDLGQSIKGFRGDFSTPSFR